MIEKRQSDQVVGLIRLVFGILSAFPIALWAIITLPFTYRLTTSIPVQPETPEPPHRLRPAAPTAEELATIEAFEPVRGGLFPSEETTGLLAKGRRDGVAQTSEPTELQIETGLERDINLDPSYGSLLSNVWHSEDINADSAFNWLPTNAWHVDNP